MVELEELADLSLRLDETVLLARRGATQRARDALDELADELQDGVPLQPVRSSRRLTA